MRLVIFYYIHIFICNVCFHFHVKVGFIILGPKFCNAAWLWASCFPNVFPFLLKVSFHPVWLECSFVNNSLLIQLDFRAFQSLKCYVVLIRHPCDLMSQCLDGRCPRPTVEGVTMWEPYGRIPPMVERWTLIGWRYHRLKNVTSIYFSVLNNRSFESYLQNFAFPCAERVLVLRFLCATLNSLSSWAYLRGLLSLSQCLLKVEVDFVRFSA